MDRRRVNVIERLAAKSAERTLVDREAIRTRSGEMADFAYYQRGADA